MVWETVLTGLVSCCFVDQRHCLVVAVRGIVPLASRITTGYSRSFSSELPVPKHPERVIFFIHETVPEGSKDCILRYNGCSAFYTFFQADGCGRFGDLILVTRNVEGKGGFRTFARNSRLLRPAGDSLILFLYSHLDGVYFNSYYYFVVPCHRPFFLLLHLLCNVDITTKGQGTHIS